MWYKVKQNRDGHHSCNCMLNNSERFGLPHFEFPSNHLQESPCYDSEEALMSDLISCRPSLQKALSGWVEEPKRPPSSASQMISLGCLQETVSCIFFSHQSAELNIIEAFICSEWQLFETSLWTALQPYWSKVLGLCWRSRQLLEIFLAVPFPVFSVLPIYHPALS